VIEGQPAIEGQTAPNQQTHALYIRCLSGRLW